jgi:hypothetical protein
VTTDLAQARFLLFSHLGSSIPLPFLVVLLLWMVILFAGFSLMAPANATTFAAKLGLGGRFTEAMPWSPKREQRAARPQRQDSIR